MKKTFIALVSFLVPACVLAQGEWTQKSITPALAGINFNCFSVGNKGYVYNGSSFWEYDPVMDVWTQKAHPETNFNLFQFTFSINNMAYAGGWYISSILNYTNHLLAYDPALNEWKNKRDFPGISRAFGLSLSIGNKGYAGLGFDFNLIPRNDFWEYDPVNDSWLQKKNYPGPARLEPIGFSIGNKGYAGTGYAGPGFNELAQAKDFWEYTPETDQWLQKADFAGGNVSLAMAFSAGNKGYIGGGVVLDAQNTIADSRKDFWQYDPATDSWLQQPDLPGSARYNAVTFTIGRLAFMGYGEYRKYQYAYAANDFWLFKPEASPPSDTTPPQLQCPAAHLFCYNNNQIYSLTPAVATDPSGIRAVSYVITGSTTRNGTGFDASGFFYPGNASIVFTVTDAAGNTATCQTTVRVDAPLTASIPDVYPLDTLGAVNTLYQGLGPGSTVLNAIASGGTKLPNGTYRYTWSDGVTDSFVTVNAAAAGEYAFRVAIIDSLGCLATASKSINVIDIRCGQKLSKAAVCWPGKHENRQACLNEKQAMMALLAGAKPGYCNVDNTANRMMPPEAKAAIKGVTVFPNPNNGLFNVALKGIGRAVITVYDQHGRVVLESMIKESKGNQTIALDLGHVATGIYILRVAAQEGQYLSRIIVQKQ